MAVCTWNSDKVYRNCEQRKHREAEQTFSELLVAWFPITCSSRDSSTLASWLEKMLLGYTAQSAVGNLPTGVSNSVRDSAIACGSREGIPVI